MTAASIHQLLPAAHVGDATGDAARHLAAALEQAGHPAPLWALTIDRPLRGLVHRFRAPHRARDGDVTLLHFALPSPLTDAFVAAPGHRVLVYHNLTPPELLAPYCPEVARLTAAGRRELARLAESGRVELAIGVSEYNAADLRRAGFSRVAALPLPMDLARFDAPGDPALDALLRRAPRIFLTVGRVAPNKRLEDLLRVAAYYLRHVDPAAWFVIVGGSRGLEGYADALARLHRRLGLDERVRFTGKVAHAELVSWYRHASVYLCTSEHEGFCAPLLEAMACGVPVLARAAAAVPETLADAGVLFDDADPAALGEMLHLLATDEALRARLRDRARARVAAFAPARVTGRWLETIEELLGR